MCVLCGGSQVSHFRVIGLPSMGWEELAVSTGLGNSSREKNKCSSQGSEALSFWEGVPVSSGLASKDRYPCGSSYLLSPSHGCLEEVAHGIPTDKHLSSIPTC